MVKTSLKTDQWESGETDLRTGLRASYWMMAILGTITLSNAIWDVPFWLNTFVGVFALFGSIMAELSYNKWEKENTN